MAILGGTLIRVIFVLLLAYATCVVTSPSASFRILSSGKEISCNGTSCSICVSGHKNADFEQVRKKRQNSNVNHECKGWKKSNQITLELAVFADHALYQEFHHRYPSNSTLLKLKLQEFIFSIIQQGRELFMSPTLTPKVKIEVVEYKVILHKFRRFSLKKVRQDMPSYMDSFCRYQKQLNVPKRWDHAVLFTGFDLIHSIHQGNFAGYSTASSVCGHTSCSLVEASSFKSAYTLAHELGHSLGMNHDNGSDACGANCCLMSPVIYSGSQNWSQCSVKDYHKYLDSIPCNKWCLGEPRAQKRPEKILPTITQLPGQIYSALDQCRHYFGPCSSPYVTDSNHLESICSELWCHYHDGTMRLAHAALDGTHCSEGKWCRFGKCIPSKQALEKRDGQWSDWMTPPLDGSCGYSKCSKPVLYDQLSIQKQLRSCTNPSPNNGGAECKGEMYRGVVCNDESDTENLIDDAPEESGSSQSIDDYATKMCTAHKRRMILENDTFVKLSGDGFQRAAYESDPNVCYIWCSTINSSFTSYTFFDALPDGTTCGQNKFCVSGKCMQRQKCNATLTLLTNDPLPECITKSPIPKLNKTSKISVFSTWSSWSECSKTCGIGVKKRTRICTPLNSSTCSKLSNTHQYQFCRGKVIRCPSQAHENVIKEHSVGKEGHISRENPKDKNDLNSDMESEDADSEIQEKSTRTVTSTLATTTSKFGRWTEWNWSECNAKCNGIQRGTRTCVPPASFCRGPGTKKRICNVEKRCRL